MLESSTSSATVHGRHRNLVVAATGTGKTVVAALDYRRLCDDLHGDRPRLLFVAHREEILEQSLRTFREVLARRRPSASCYVGGARPERGTMSSPRPVAARRTASTNIPTDHFDVVVVDEFHHAEAPTYRRLLDHLRPSELLGLTATPERADGVDVREFFDGRIAAELRLWDALDADLLCPFQYFGVADDADLRASSGAAAATTWPALDSVYTGNDARARIVLEQLRDKVARRPARCARSASASASRTREYMAHGLQRRRHPALAPSAGTTPRPSAQRRSARPCATARSTCLFAVDLFNEGLDVPEVDTVLFLRPTESATVFLQQLGRGLRARLARRADRAGLHRPAPPGVPLRPRYAR